MLPFCCIATSPEEAVVLRTACKVHCPWHQKFSRKNELCSTATFTRLRDRTYSEALALTQVPVFVFCYCLRKNKSSECILNTSNNFLKRVENGYPPKAAQPFPLCLFIYIDSLSSSQIRDTSGSGSVYIVVYHTFSCIRVLSPSQK